MQPHLIKRLIDKFGEEVEELCHYGTPGTPRFKIVRPDDTDKVDAANTGLELVCFCTLSSIRGQTWQTW
jgi:hypothetical protein